MDVVVVGNPGMGKSTILSTASGIQFESGVSFGSGMTRRLHFQPSIGYIRYADTPGLADPKLKKMAAEAIYDALTTATRNNRELKLLLVCTLDAGRVREADLQTMHFIMDSIRQENGASLEKNKYAVIINKCSKKVLHQLDNASDEYPGMTNREIVCAYFQKASPNLNFTTNQILFLPKVEDLEDADNECFHGTNAGLIKNFINNATSMNIARANVEHINTDTIDETRAKMRAENERNEKKWMEELSAQKEIQKAQEREMARMNEEMIERRREATRMKNELEAQRREYERQAAAAERRRLAERREENARRKREA